MTALEERQRELSHLVHMVAKGMSDGLFIFGAGGGLGKSETVRRTLGKEGITPVTINSHATALGMYQTLYENRSGKVIFIDDADSMYSDMKVLGLLRSALWGSPRMVTYTSSQLPEELPQSFVFESAIIMAANEIPKKSAAFKATLSRIDTFELKASNEEVLEFMRVIALEKGYPGVLSSEVMAVIDFFESEAGNRQLSLRLLELSCKKVLYAREVGLDWRDLVRTQLHTLGERTFSDEVDSAAHDLECMRRAFEEHPDSARQQQAYWMKLTSKSRATYFRIKKQYQNQQA